MAFRLPGGDDRTTVLGATGTGKTTCGAWLLSRQRFDRRPWLIFDYKHEVLFDRVGFPPIQELDVGHMPGRQGIYLVTPTPGDESRVEDYLWKLWARGNVGLFIDEAFLLPDKHAFRAILQQGRSKRIPVIACTQRPADVPRALYSEASFFCLYRLTDKRDYKTIEGFIPGSNLSAPMPPKFWRWYDVANNELLKMRPVPPPDTIVRDMKRNIPYTWHPFAWKHAVSGR